MGGLFNWLSQIVSVTKCGLMTIPRRPGAVGATIFGIAGVVTVLVWVLSIAEGYQRAMTVSASPDTALVMRSGADNEMVSGLSHDDTRVIADSAGIVQTGDGPAASAELFVIISLPKRSSMTDANVPLRGVEPAAFQVRDNLKIIKGRRFETGRNEVIAGVGAANQFAGLDVGAKVLVGREQWDVVGLFTAGGGIAESEVWADAPVLQGAFNRGDNFQAVYAKLTSSAAYKEFTNSLLTNPRLNIKVLKQSEYYAEQSTSVTRLIRTLGFLIASLMAVGAVFGALNTMYSAVSARTREIATLRALGFGNGPVVVSVMIESLVLALIGGVIGGAIAYFAFDGFRTSTLNWQSFSQVTFAFDVTPQLLIRGIIWSAIIGLIGGTFPALRAARLPIAAALREM